MSFATSDGLCLHWSLLYGLNKNVQLYARGKECGWGGQKTFRTVTLVTVTLEASEHPGMLWHR